jgi:Methylamine utilisation protein MauE
MTGGDLSGPYFAAVVLLGGAGAAKLVRPRFAADALGVLGVKRGARAIVRGLATYELAVACACIAGGSRFAPFLLAATYFAFAVFGVALIASGHTEVSCGCFGVASHPVTYLHVIVNLTLGGAATAVGLLGHPGVAGWMKPTLTSVVALLASLGGTYLLYIGMTLLPQVERGRRAQSHDAEDGVRLNESPQPFSLQISNG